MTLSQVTTTCTQIATHFVKTNPTVSMAVCTSICAFAALEMAAKVFDNGCEIHEGLKNRKRDGSYNQEEELSRNIAENVCGSIFFGFLAANTMGLYIPLAAVTIPSSVVGTSFLLLNGLIHTERQNLTYITKGVKYIKNEALPAFWENITAAVEIAIGLFVMIARHVAHAYNQLKSKVDLIIPESNLAKGAALIVGMIAIKVCFF